MAEPPGKSIKERRVIDFPVIGTGEMSSMVSKRWRNQPSWRRWLPNAVGAAHGVLRATRNVQRSSRSFTRTRGGQRSAPKPVTGESDWSRLYRKKRFPRRRKRRWVGFVRKVKHVIHKQVAPQFNVMVRTDAQTNIAGQQETSDVFTVLGSNGGFGDLSQLFDRALAMADTEQPALTSVTKEQLKIVVSGWLAECMVSNIGENLAYLDCYYWRTKRDVPAAITSFETLFDESLSDIGANISPTATETTLSRTDYGVTPFQGVQLAKSCEIWKKVRVKVPPGGTTQFELRSGKNYYRVWSHDEHYSLLSRVTEGIFFIWYGAPTAAVAVTSPATLSFSVNVNYTWRIVQDNRMRGMHDAP